MTGHTYYLVRRNNGVELRQTRFKELFEAGTDHPHDVCAFAFGKEQMREMCERSGLGPVDWDSIDDDPTYKVVRKWFKEKDDETIHTGLSLEEAKEHCSSDDSKGSTPDGNKWMDCFYEE